MSMTLEKVRKVIDLIDEEILALLAERLTLVGTVPKLKNIIQDKDREESILDRLRSTAKKNGRLREEFVELIYSEILAESRRLQERGGL